VAGPGADALRRPAAPQWVEPRAPGGLFGKKRHAEQVAQARQAFDVQYVQWRQSVATLEQEHRDALEAHNALERQRAERLEQARNAYAAECAERERERTAANARLDELISGLAYGVESAVQEYVTIVLANSAYPDGFPVGYEHSFDAGTGELTVSVEVPAPAEIPSVKAYKYTKATDEITSAALPMKEQKDRYANAVLQVTLRTLHEVFEADRAGHIRTVAAIIGTTALNPATGRNEYVPLAMVAADRETFMTLDLEKVVPAATLAHLGGVISKKPFDLAPIDTGRGVRGRS
jgi:restriction system protein